MDIALQKMTKVPVLKRNNTCISCGTDTDNWCVHVFVSKSFLPIGMLCLNCANKLVILYTGRFPSFSFGDTVSLYDAIPNYIPTKKQCRKYIQAKLAN